MLEKLISSVLNQVLGNFIENLDADQLKISLWSSTVKLENLQIKPTLFDSMPVPFTMHYGKVGKIFIDIPVMNINNSPLKLEISDVFMFIKPKHFRNWSEKVEIEAFINQTFNFLDKYEDYLTEKTQLEQQNPGMIAGLVSKIIDNIQLKITNVYIRIEDTLSIPRMPIVLGLVIGSIQAETMNEKWQPQFTANAEITNKEFSIKDFALYMNFQEMPQPGMGEQAEILFDQITKDWKEKDTDKKYMQFLRRECTFEESALNNYLIERFELTLRASINKNVRNRKPQIWANMVLGGEFKGMDHEIVSEFGKYFYFSIQQQQITGIVKLLEYIGHYGKFQAGVTSKFYKNEMTTQQEADYTKLYLRYKELLSKKDKEAELIKTKMREDYEKHNNFDKLVLIRTIATKKFEFEVIKKQEEQKIQSKIKEIESSKSGIMTSIKGMFGIGKKTQEEEEEEMRQNQAIREKLEKEAIDKIQNSNQQLMQQINMLKTTGKVDGNQLGPEFKDLIGTDWAQFEAKVTIPEVHFVLRRADNNRLIEIIVDEMKAFAQVGLDFQDATFSLHTFNIRDHTFPYLNPDLDTAAPFPYLLETYIPPDLTKSLLQADKNALNVRFQNNPRLVKSKKEGSCQMKLILKSDSQLFIFANFACINELKNLFTRALATSQNSYELVDYYKGVASDQLFKYVNEGSELMLTLQESEQANQKKTHAAIMLDMNLNAPVLFVPERYDTMMENEVLVIDMGSIKIDSKLIDFDPTLNYKKVINPIQLFDAYNFLLKDTQILGFGYLRDYRLYSSPQMLPFHVKLLKDVTLKLSFFNNIEQRHPTLPNYEISIALENMTVTASDYIFQSMMRLKDKVLANMNPPSSTLQEIELQKSSVIRGESINQNIVIEEVKSGVGIQNEENELEQKLKELNVDTKLQIPSSSDERRQSRSLSILEKAGSQFQKRLSERPNVNINKPQEGIAMNVIVKIGCLELDIHEQIQPEDKDFDVNQPSQVQHKELMKVRMTDLILNYFVDKVGKQTISLILLHFDVIDKATLRSKKGRRIPIVPEVFGHIISNPAFKVRRQIQQHIEFDTAKQYPPNIIEEEEEIKESYQNMDSGNTDPKSLKISPNLNQFRNKTQGRTFSFLSTGGGQKHYMDQIKNRSNSRRGSSFSGNEFRSCISAFSSVTSLNIQEIVDSEYQIYSKIIIEQKDADTQKIDVDFIFSDLQLVISFSTFERMIKFSRKLSPPQQDQSDDDLYSRQMSLYSVDQLRKSTIINAATDLKRRASQVIEQNDNRVSNRMSQLIVEEDQNMLMFEPQPTKQVIKKQKIRFTGRFKSIDLWIPLDSRQKYSRVFSFSLMSQVNFRRDQTSLETVDLSTNQTVSSEVQNCRDDAIVTINQLQMTMINRHMLPGAKGGQDQENSSISGDFEFEEDPELMQEEESQISSEKLLEPSRITVTYENLVKEAGLKTFMTADVNVEPFEIKLGFRELEFFTLLNKNLQDFLLVLNAETNEDTYSDTHTKDTEIDIDKKLRQMRRKEFQEFEELKRQQESEMITSNRIQIKNKEQVQVMTIKFRCDTFRLSLMDDTGLQEFPVIFMNIRNIKYDSRKYEDVDDAACFILKKMGIIKRKSEEEEPFLNNKASLTLEIQYFNMNVQQYEPFMEPWVIQFSQHQEEKYTGDITSLSSPQMLNLNVTFALMENLVKVQKYLSQTSDDWTDEQAKQGGGSERGSQVAVAGISNARKDTPSFGIKRDNQSSQPDLILRNNNTQQDQGMLIKKKSAPSDNHLNHHDTNSAGFTFINHLGLECQLTIEGYEQYEQRKQEAESILKGRAVAQIKKDKTTKSKPLQELQTELEKLKKVKNGDPRINQLKMQLIRQIEAKKKEGDTIEETTLLESQGPGSKVFRKSDEMYFVLKQIKKSKPNSSQVATLEDEILRIDISIDGYKPITSIPIELGGVRSYLLEEKPIRMIQGDSDDEEEMATSEAENLQKSGKQSKSDQIDLEMENKRTAVAVICKVKFETQTRKDIELQSALLFSNCSQHDLTLYSVEEFSRLKDFYKKPNDTKDDLLIGSKQSRPKNIIRQKDIKRENVFVVESGRVFYVPLSWFIEDRAIYIKRQDGEFHQLFPDIREYFQPKPDNNFAHIEPQNLDIFNESSEEANFVSMNCGLFKCKPTQQNVPGQFLVTFTPPVCVQNFMFTDLSLLKPNGEIQGYAESKGFFYLNDVKFDPFEDRGLCARNQVKWRFADDVNGYYQSMQPQNLFLPRRPQKKENFNNQLAANTVQATLRTQKALERGDPWANGLIAALKRNQAAAINNSQAFTEEESKNGEESNFKNSQSPSNNHLSQEPDSQISEDSIINIEMIPFNVLNNEYDNFELRDKVFEKTSAVMLQVYPQFMIVNQTDFDLQIKTLAEGIVNNKMRVILVKSHSNDFFYSSNYKAQFKVDGYDWSKVFDGTTMGLSGFVEVKSQDPDDRKRDKFLNFGVIFENGDGHYSRTKIIKIVPRYIIFNSLEDDIVIRQRNHDREFIIKADDRTRVYNFQNREKDPLIRLSDAAPSFEMLEEQKQDDQMIFEEQKEEYDGKWSTAFSIDDVGDFQVEFESQIYTMGHDRSTIGRRMTTSVHNNNHQGRAFKVWHMPNDNNFNKRIVRVTISTQDDATIFIKICKPKFPEYYIHNDTEVPIEFWQFKADHIKPRVIPPGKKFPFVWLDQTQPVKKLTLRVEGQIKNLMIDKIYTKTVTTSNDKFFLNVINTSDVRTIDLKSKNAMAKRQKRKELGSSILAKMMLQNMMKKESKLKIDLKGLGISLIDNEPKEILYLSIYKMQFLIEKWTEQTSNENEGGVDLERVNEQVTKYDLRIDHIQIDNMLNNLMPVFFCPVRELLKDEDKTAQDHEEEYTPFIQAMITYSEIQEKDVYIKKYRGLQFAIQEMKLQVETGFVNSLLKFTQQIMAVQSQETSQAIGFQSRNQIAKRKTLHNRESSLMQTTKLALPREQVCESLRAGLPEILPELQQSNDKKMFFELIHLGAIKIRITMKFEKKALEVNLRQGLVIGSLLQIVFTTVATISDSPLTFKELIIMNTYTTQDNLVSMLTRNYTRQGILQFYKLIGSSDLLGNPVGLIDKLGTGVFEFFNEPRKGLLKGPKEFVGGVGKGVKSLVTNIVSGGFDSVSKITGSLYGVLKNVSGDEVNEEQMALKKPEHAFDGIYQGLKGGVSELADGLTGLFTKPFKQAKQEGALGFLKGLGSGAVGLVASPFAATLRLGNNVSTGIKNSAIRIGKGKLPSYGRFRHPRYFNSKNILQPFDEAVAEANEILKTIKHGFYANSTIRFFADFSEKKKKRSGLLIITDSQLLYVLDFKELKYHSELRNVFKCEVYEEKLTVKRSKVIMNEIESNEGEVADNKLRNNKKIMQSKMQIIEEEKEEEEESKQQAIQQLQKAKKQKIQSISGAKINYNYVLAVQSTKRPGGKKIQTLKLESEDYPIVDKVYSILSNS